MAASRPHAVQASGRYRRTSVLWAGWTILLLQDPAPPLPLVSLTCASGQGHWRGFGCGPGAWAGGGGGMLAGRCWGLVMCGAALCLVFGRRDGGGGGYEGNKSFVYLKSASGF